MPDYGEHADLRLGFGRSSPLKPIAGAYRAGPCLTDVLTAAVAREYSLLL